MRRPAVESWMRRAAAESRMRRAAAERRSGRWCRRASSGRCRGMREAAKSRRTTMMRVADDDDGGGDSAGDDDARDGEGVWRGWFAQRRDEEDGFWCLIIFLFATDQRQIMSVAISDRIMYVTDL
ncbi:hypothetical protein Scep_014793 [Stephania cephalantha]|uniref:Uncharacterized protein n=1 Tax=Stephania cephalantha TaxID=152367 RepID=A0AAP0NZR8_9MAGN